MMLPRLEVGFVLLCLEMHQSREEQYHVPAFVHDWRMTVAAANFTRQLMLDTLAGGIVPLQIVMSMREVDIRLVEDCSPLKWSG